MMCGWMNEHMDDGLMYVPMTAWMDETISGWMMNGSRWMDG